MSIHLEERREQMLQKARKYLIEAEEFRRTHGAEEGPPLERAMLSALMSLLWLHAAELETQGVRLVEKVPE